MSRATDIDDIEQMFSDIVGEDGGHNASTAAASAKSAAKGAALEIKGKPAAEQGFFEHSETPTPAQEPLEFVASPVRQTQEVLARASASALSDERTPQTARKGSSLDIVESKPEVESKDQLSRVESASYIEIPKPKSLVDFREIKAVDAPAQSELSPRTEPASPVLAPSLVPLTSMPRHGEQEQEQEQDSERHPSIALEKLTREGDHAKIRAERESTSQGVLSPNTSKDPLGDMEKAIRRASSSAPPRRPFIERKRSSLVPASAIDDSRYAAPRDEPVSRRTSRLESIAREGTPSQIRKERESTSQGILSPNLSKDPVSDLEQAIRRASSVSRNSLSVSTQDAFRRRLSSNAIDDTEADAAVQSPRTFRLQSITKEGTLAEIRAERESTSVGVLSPNTSKDPLGDMEKAIRRASSSAAKTPIKPKRDSLKVEAPKLHRRSSSVADAPTSPRTFRLQSLAHEGTPAEIRKERESTSEGILSPNKFADPEDELSKAIRRASSHSKPPQIPKYRRASSFAVDDEEADIPLQSPRTVRLESLTREGTPAQIRAERESTSEGVLSPNTSKDPLGDMEKAIRRASQASTKRPSLVTRPSLTVVDTSKESPSRASRDGSISGRKRRTSTASQDAAASPPKDAINEAAKEIDSPVEMMRRLSTSAVDEPKQEPQSPLAVAASKAATGSATGTPTEMLPVQEVTEPPTPAPELEPKKVDSDTVYLYTSMASGGRGAMQNFQKASSILQTYNVTFTPVEITLDEEARKLWKYRGISKNKQLPAVVRDREIKLDFNELLAADEDEEVSEIIFEEF